MFGTLLAIAGYGVYRTYGVRDMESYIRGSGNMNWWTIGLSIMATQASAITFLSTPTGLRDGVRLSNLFWTTVGHDNFQTFLPMYYKRKSHGL